MKFIMNINEATDSLFDELEHLSYGNRAYQYESADMPDANSAAMALARRLVPFFETRLQEVKDDPESVPSPTE